MPAVRRIRVLPVEHGEPHGSPRKERRVQKLLYVRDPGHPAGGVRERDQRVRLAATVGGVEPEDRRGLAAGPGEPTTDVAEQRLQAARRMRVPEEPHRIAVFLRPSATHDGSQIGRELGITDGARQHISARPASLENGRDGHLRGAFSMFYRADCAASQPDGDANEEGNPTGAVRHRPAGRNERAASVTWLEPGGFA